MSQLKPCTSVSATSSGLIGFRVWTLKGYDGRKLIATVSRNMHDNNTKYNAFKAALKKKGYGLSKKHHAYFKDKLCLSIPWDSRMINPQHYMMEKTIEKVGPPALKVVKGAVEAAVKCVKGAVDAVNALGDKQRAYVNATLQKLITGKYDAQQLARELKRTDAKLVAAAKDVYGGAMHLASLGSPAGLALAVAIEAGIEEMGRVAKNAEDVAKITKIGEDFRKAKAMKNPVAMAQAFLKIMSTINSTVNSTVAVAKIARTPKLLAARADTSMVGATIRIVHKKRGNALFVSDYRDGDGDGEVFTGPARRYTTDGKEKFSVERSGDGGWLYITNDKKGRGHLLFPSARKDNDGDHRILCGPRRPYTSGDRGKWKIVGDELVNKMYGRLVVFASGATDNDGDSYMYLGPKRSHTRKCGTALQFERISGPRSSNATRRRRA